MAAAAGGRGVFIVGAKRTAFGAFGGKLKGHSQTDLAVVAAQGALESAGGSAGDVEQVTMGMVNPASTDAIYMARHVGLRAGAPVATPALHVNRLCGSGFQAAVTSAQHVLLGEARLCLAGGTENMSQSPYAVRDIRWGTRFGKPMELEDTLWSALTDSYCKLPMAITAENLAEKYGLTREDCDSYALRSQKTWSDAHDAGVYADEIVPVILKTRKGTEEFVVDEHPRPGTTMEGLAKLPPVFKKDGVVSAGNASGICDGAAAMAIASEDYVQEKNLTPLARIVAWDVAGVDPSIMGIGPVPAIRGALAKAGLTIADMGAVEINEAFAAQYLACEKELGLDRSITNRHGGAIALGHPLGASGARILTHLAHDLHRSGHKYAVGAACIGGGQGIAVVLEKC